MAHPRLGLAIVVAAVASLWAYEKKPANQGEKFIYPNAERTGLLGGKILNLRMDTKDSFDKVIEFYEVATKEKLRVDDAGSAELRGVDRILIDDSKDRPLQARIFVHHAKKYFLTIVISRAKEEKRTHIALVFKEREKE